MLVHPLIQCLHSSPDDLSQKKGAKGQKVVAQIKQQQSVSGKSPAALAKEKERDLREKEKAEAEKRAREEAKLFTQPPQKVPPGVDPKTIYCNYHKAGYCEKGNKCKFSHDPNIGRKVEKRDVYSDSREEKLQGLGSSFALDGLLILKRYRYNGYMGRREVAKSSEHEGEPQNNH